MLTLRPWRESGRTHVIDCRTLSAARPRDARKLMKFVARHGRSAPFAAEIALGQPKPTGFQRLVVFERGFDGRQIFTGVETLVYGPRDEPVLPYIVRRDGGRARTRQLLLQAALVQCATNPALADIDRILVIVLLREVRSGLLVDARDAGRLLRERESQGFVQMDVSKELFELVEHETGGALPLFVGMDGKRARRLGQQLALLGYGLPVRASRGRPKSLREVIDAARPVNLALELGVVKFPLLWEGSLIRLALEFGERSEPPQNDI
jgi:hypothetical protein